MISSTERSSCPEHHGLCAFTGYEPDRCPWCHCLWDVIHRSGWHSCEVPVNAVSPWRGVERDRRIRVARWMRLGHLKEHQP